MQHACGRTSPCFSSFSKVVELVLLASSRGRVPAPDADDLRWFRDDAAGQLREHRISRPWSRCCRPEARAMGASRT